MKKLGSVACVILALVACKSGDDDDSIGGTGGMAAGTGGMVVGTGGMVGTGGTGAAGTGGGDVTTCAGADKTAAPAALYASAAEVLAVMSPCGFGSCHVTPDGKAKLVLFDVKAGAAALDIKTALVGKMSCERPTMPLVDPAGGDAALNNSWLWHKLIDPADADGKLASDAAWGQPGTCGQMGGQPFGSRMPANNGDMKVSDARLAKIRNWICGGAPGPQ